MTNLSIHDVLEQIFGYKSFRFDQEEIINCVLNKEDVLAIMPTGGGKSLCYQVPALTSEGLAIIISPLIALMDDQVLALKQLGVKAACIHSHIDYEEKLRIDDMIRNNELKLLYVSPEKVRSGRFLEYLKTKDISLFAVDEAHCVSVWGNDFRPDYVELKALKVNFPDVPLIALTATADTVTQDDIITQLGIVDARRFISSFERKNLSSICKPGQELSLIHI